MFKERKVVVVMPAYNAEKTLRRTHDEVLAQGIVDQVIVVDDASADETSAIAGRGVQVGVLTHVVGVVATGVTAPRRRVAGAVVNQVQVRIVGAHVPGCAAAGFPGIR